MQASLLVYQAGSYNEYGVVKTDDGRVANGLETTMVARCWQRITSKAGAEASSVPCFRVIVEPVYDFIAATLMLSVKVEVVAS